MRNKSVMKQSFCIWTEVNLNDVANLQPNFISQSKSQYFYTENGVFRLSDHWGRTANSKWRLIPMDDAVRKVRLGYANFVDFHKDNATEKLYFIEVDFVSSTVFFNHKNNKKDACEAYLRTSAETTKTIRKIRNLLENQSWARHFEDKNIVKKVVKELINSNKSVIDSKKMFQ